MMNAFDLITLAEIRREEWLQQAEQNRRLKQAASKKSNRGRRGSDLRVAVMALGARVGALRPRRAASQPIDLTPAASETA